MPTPNVLEITVHFEFPARDNTLQPNVSNSSGESDDVLSAHTGIRWVVSTNLPPGTDDDELRITGVTFYSDSSKTRTIQPAFLVLPGSATADGGWEISFGTQAVANETDLIYSLDYEDDDYASLDWDPTLVIKPRPASSGLMGGGLMGMAGA